MKKDKPIKIGAKAMTLGEFNKLKGWDEVSCFNQQGYMIIYSDGATTWTTKEIYESGMR